MGYSTLAGHGAILAAGAAIVYASPLYSINVGTGDLAAYDVVPYEIRCFAARSEVSGIDCSGKTGFAACYDTLDSIIECDSMVLGITNQAKQDSFTISAGLAVLVSCLGFAFLLEAAASVFPSFLGSFASLAVFMRLIAAIGGVATLIALSRLLDGVEHGENDGSQQTTEMGPAIVAALASPIFSLALDAA